MDTITIEITPDSEGNLIYKLWAKDIEGAYEANEQEEFVDEGNDNGGACTGNMTDALGMALESAYKMVHDSNSDNAFNPDICPSSLNENLEPATEGETAHKYGEPFTNAVGEKVRECDECGAVDEMEDTIK